MVDCVSPDGGCEVLEGESLVMKNGIKMTKNVADSDDTHILIKWGSL